MIFAPFFPWGALLISRRRNSPSDVFIFSFMLFLSAFFPNYKGICIVECIMWVINHYYGLPWYSKQWNWYYIGGTFLIAHLLCNFVLIFIFICRMQPTTFLFLLRLTALIPNLHILMSETEYCVIILCNTICIVDSNNMYHACIVSQNKSWDLI